MEDSKKRIEWIDTARGMLIILMVLGHNHINTMILMTINSFHMAAFFLISGLTLKVSEPVGVFIWKKCKRLLFPYFIFAIIMLFYQFGKTLIFSDALFDLKGGIISIFILTGGREPTSTYGLWFLPCLFLAEIIAYFIVKMWDRSKIIGIAVFFAVVVLGNAVYRLSAKSSIIAILPIALVFIIIGHIFKRKPLLIEKNCILLIYSWLMFVIFVVANWWYCRDVVGLDVVDLSHMRIGFWPLFMASSLFGSIIICKLAIVIKYNKVFVALGQDSLYYYGLHYELLGVAGKVFPGAVLRTGFTLAVLYLIIWLYKKGKVLFGGRFIND